MRTTGKATKPAEEIRGIVIKVDRNGRRRAQYLARLQFRMFPMPIAEADLMLATGRAILCDRHPITGEPIRPALTVVR